MKVVTFKIKMMMTEEEHKEESECASKKGMTLEEYLEQILSSTEFGAECSDVEVKDV